MRFFFALLFWLLPAAAHAAPQTAVLNGAPISVETCGQETAAGLVLLHDGLANSALWDEVWPALCEKYRVVRYDRRGYGKSPAAKEWHSPVEDLAAVMKHAGLAHAHLVGAFTGAAIAIDFLLEYPEAVDNVVLVAPNMAGFPPPDQVLLRLQAIEEHIRGGDMDATIAAIRADPHFMAPENVAARDKLEKILRGSPADLGAHPMQRRSNETRRRLSEVYAPVLVLIGGADDPYNQAVAVAVQSAVRAGKMTALLGAGQLLYLEQPAAFVAAVTEFLG